MRIITLPPYSVTEPRTATIFWRTFQPLEWKVFPPHVSAMPQKRHFLQLRSGRRQGMVVECSEGDKEKCTEEHETLAGLCCKIQRDTQVNLIGRGRLRAVWFACWEQLDLLGKVGVLLYQQLCSE
uniref:Uncharacterized protein n=1 Tax=Spironucleus salmonicida TaxID=348837 RepID=V6LEQ9_9EUKA|eukprot:EST42748.1 Hypothetical protein SS50377_17606 [Spironucleus salmonicida]